MNELREKLGRRLHELMYQEFIKCEPAYAVGKRVAFDSLDPCRQDAMCNSAMALWGDFVAENAEALADYNLKQQARPLMEEES